ncbi:MAG: hypothetical protein ACR2IK_10600 [Chloroflexota bacterium]
MSDASSSDGAADTGPELEEIASELYALQPEAFAAARDEQIRKARSTGRQPLARELSRLRRPTQSAWLINALWRDQRDIVQQFLQLADELSRAQTAASAPELQRLSGQRRELEAALLRAARGLAREAGVDVSGSMEREAQETLSAALAQPDVAQAVRTGRLVKPAAYAGFGVLIPAGAARAPEPAKPVVPIQPELDDHDALAARRERQRRQAAERDVHAARTALDAAAERLAEQERAATQAHRQHQVAVEEVAQVQAQLQQLQDRLRQLQTAVADAERASASAATQRQQVSQAHQTAVETLQRAEHQARV